MFDWLIDWFIDSLIHWFIYFSLFTQGNVGDVGEPGDDGPQGPPGVRGLPGGASAVSTRKRAANVSESNKDGRCCFSINFTMIYSLPWDLLGRHKRTRSKWCWELDQGRTREPCKSWFVSCVILLRIYIWYYIVMTTTYVIFTVSFSIV